MASTLLPIIGLGREVEVQGIDPSRSPTRIRPRDDPNEEIARQIQRQAEEVKDAERRTEIVQQQSVQRLTALGRVRRADTLREIIRTAQGELSGGGLLVNRLA